MYAAVIERGLLAAVQDMFSEVSQRNFLIASLRFRTSDRSEWTLAPVLLHLAHLAPLLAALLLELAAVLNVLDHSGRQQGDRLGHPGSADGAVGVGPLVAGRAHQVALGAAVDGPRGGHLQAHWALDTFLQLLSQGFQGLLARLQLALN